VESCEAPLPATVMREEAVGLDEWGESIAKALAAMRRGQYRKVGMQVHGSGDCTA
jgi:hypothetical protein